MRALAPDESSPLVHQCRICRSEQDTKISVLAQAFHFRVTLKATGIKGPEGTAFAEASLSELEITKKQTF